MSSSFLTVQQHILAEQRRHHPHASGEFSWLLSGITMATKLIASRVRRAGLTDILGATEETNVQNETLQKLDVFANKALPHFLGNPTGKLRLLYQANPIAFLAEQAGGMAIDGKQRTLDVIPTELHQRVPLSVGSREEMELLQQTLQESTS